VDIQHLPLFPLHTVLFPGGPLPLRIFEPRYLEMVSRCLRTDTGFGVALIRHGREVGEVALTHEVGTVARIVDWHQRHDGLLGVSSRGEARFRILSTEVQPNQLTVARVELWPEAAHLALPNRHLPLADLLRRLLDQAGHLYADVPRRFGDADWVGCRLSELLPLENGRKQALLEMDDPLERLERLLALLSGLELG